MESASSDQRQWVLEVLAEYEIPLLRFALRLLGDEPTARDCVQHVFLQLCAQSGQTLRDRVGQWLFAVCRNKAVDLVRYRNSAAGGAEGELSQAAGTEIDPAIAAEQEDLYRCIRRLMGQLPLPQREALALWSEGLGYRQIAALTHTTEGNVRVIVHRALNQLRQHPLAQQLLLSISSEA